MSEFNLFVYGTLRGGATGGATAGAASGTTDGATPGATAAATPGAAAAATPGVARLMTGCVKVAEGTIGGTLYDIEGRFPALVHYGSDPVRGEIWRCPADLLLALDSYEGTASGLFRRVAVEIESDTGELMPCWVYTAGPALSRQMTPANRVTSGIWQPRSA